MTVCDQFGEMTPEQFNGDDDTKPDDVEAEKYAVYVTSLEGMTKRGLEDEYEELVADFQSVAADHTTAFEAYGSSFTDYKIIFEKVQVIQEIGGSLYISGDSEAPEDLWDVVGLEVGIPVAAVGVGTSLVSVMSVVRRYKEGAAATKALKKVGAVLPDEAPASWYGKLFASKGFAALGATIGVLTAGAALYFSISSHLAEIKLYKEECPKLYRAIFENCRAIRALKEARLAMDAEIEAMIEALVDTGEFPTKPAQIAEVKRLLNGTQLKAGEAQALLSSADRMLDAGLTIADIATYTGLSEQFVTLLKQHKDGV